MKYLQKQSYLKSMKSITKYNRLYNGKDTKKQQFDSLKRKYSVNEFTYFPCKCLKTLMSLYIYILGKHNTLWMNLLTSNTYKSALALEIHESLNLSNITFDSLS